MQKKLQLKEKKRREDVAVRKIQRLIRKFLFVSRLKYAFYKTHVRRLAALKIFRLWKRLKALQLKGRAECAAALLIQRYMKGFRANRLFNDLKTIEERLRRNEILNRMQAQRKLDSGKMIAKFSISRIKIAKAKKVLK